MRPIRNEKYLIREDIRFCMDCPYCITLVFPKCDGILGATELYCSHPKASFEEEIYYGWSPHKHIVTTSEGCPLRRRTKHLKAMCLRISKCSECPYCQARKENWTCMHPDRTGYGLLTKKAEEKAPKTLHSWCPIGPTEEEQDEIDEMIQENMRKDTKKIK